MIRDNIHFLIDWFDSCFSFYHVSLVVLIIVRILVWSANNGDESTIGLALLSGFCLWVLWCVYRQGYGVG